MQNIYNKMLFVINNINKNQIKLIDTRLNNLSKQQQLYI